MIEPIGYPRASASVVTNNIKLGDRANFIEHFREVGEISTRFVNAVLSDASDVETVASIGRKFCDAFKSARLSWQIMTQGVVVAKCGTDADRAEFETIVIKSCERIDVYTRRVQLLDSRNQYRVVLMFAAKRYGAALDLPSLMI